ncbi:lysophospholipase [Aquabacterium sp.]|uniref:alpha/beta hydrolase n=1 Tax=Aquabacterium sp. TaxID=1872578 RepID=UPI002E358913|nr:lysophospholipase [Aquabacterium sp.]HEX5312814.1 alpha/beta hydrolase [Aquabacterium sp.]
MQHSEKRKLAGRIGWVLMASALSLALSACSTPPTRAIPEPEILSAPDGVRFEMRYFYGQDGTRLFRQAWLPESQAKGVLIVVPGLKDHGGRYAELGQQLAKEGFAVFLPDLRGHGHSSGPRQAIDNFNDYLVDLAVMVRQTRKQLPGTPTFLLGHDMGGLIAARFVETVPNAVQGLAVSGAPLAIKDSKYKLFGLKVLSKIAPSSTAMSPEFKDYSQDPVVAQSLQNDPLVTPNGVPAKTRAQQVEATRLLQEQQERLKLPVLVMHGISDQLYPLFGSIAFYDAIPSDNKGLKQYPGMGHDLWREPGNNEVAADLSDWMNGLLIRQRSAKRKELAASAEPVNN